MKLIGPGDRVGAYRLLEIVAEGGMGIVYRAEHERLARIAAVKVLPPRLASDHEFRARFARESRLAASIDHPNIVPVYDAGEDDGVLYVAMRYVHGSDLGRLLRGGSLTPSRVVAILRPVASALDAAHAAGLVHRDVKPSNVLVAESGQVFLADFGIALHEAATRITRTGEFVGSLNYSAPEQFGLWPVDARADQYALACVLYESLTGRPPFPRETAWAAMRAHLDESPPRLTEERADLPAAIDEVVAKGMAKRPDDRFGRTSELMAAAADALGVEGTDAPSGAAPSPPPRAPTNDVTRDRTPDLGAADTDVVPPRRRRTGIAVAASVAALGVLGFIGYGIIRPHTVPLPLEIAFGGQLDGTPRLLLVRADGGDLRPLGGDEAAGTSPSWSPDGARVAFESVTAFLEDSEIFVMDADGSNLTRLTDDDLDDRAPAWSPDGSRIAFERAGGILEDSEIYVMDTDGGDVRQLTDNEVPDHAPAWAPDGSTIAFESPSGGFFEDSEIFAIDAGGGEPEQLTDDEADDHAPAWSPDGTEIAFARDDPSGGSSIYVMAAEGGNERELTGGASDGAPAWSPDGRLIAFERATTDGGDTEIYVIDVDGTGLRQLTEDDVDARGPDFRPR